MQSAKSPRDRAYPTRKTGRFISAEAFEN